MSAAAKHTAEPWRASGMDIKQDVGPQYGGRLIALTGPSVRAIEGGYPAACEAEDVANAKRAVVCVNACAGIADPAELRAQRDELLAALKELLSRYVGLAESGDAGNWNTEEESEVIAARAAIAKAEGGQP